MHYLKTYLFETISYFNIAIKVVSQRIVKMQQIQANLETIKTLLKLSKKERAISISFHEDLDNRLGKVSNLLVKAFKAH